MQVEMPNVLVHFVQLLWVTEVTCECELYTCVQGMRYMNVMSAQMTCLWG